MNDLSDSIQRIITQIAMKESKTWIRIYERKANGGRPPGVNEIIAIANMAGARRALETAIEHLTAQARLDDVNTTTN